MEKIKLTFELTDKELKNLNWQFVELDCQRVGDVVRAALNLQNFILKNKDCRLLLEKDGKYREIILAQDGNRFN